MTKLKATITAIDEINSQDQNTISFEGISYPKELIYGKQMSDCLEQHWPNSSDTLQIAVRAQHIKRWYLKRTEFAQGKAGYYQWRIALGKYHAELTEKIMLEQDYSIELAAETASILRKENLKNNTKTQTLEDVACLVFLQYYFDDFAKKYTEKGNEEKIIRIIQKTWGKMSDKGHDIALAMSFPDHLAKLIQKALA
jgi:hypothetical protein